MVSGTFLHRTMQKIWDMDRLGIIISYLNDDPTLDVEKKMQELKESGLAAQKTFEEWTNKRSAADFSSGPQIKIQEDRQTEFLEARKQEIDIFLRLPVRKLKQKSKKIKVVEIRRHNVNCLGVIFWGLLFYLDVWSLLLGRLILCCNFSVKTQ